MSKKPITISVWHKDGIITNNNQTVGEVYINDKLRSTGGKEEHIVLSLLNI